MEFFPIEIIGLSSLFSFSAVLVWRGDTAWEWGCWRKGRYRQDGCRQYSRNPAIKCAAVSVLLSDSFRITLLVLYFHCTVKALFVQTPFFYSRKGDSVLMAFIVRPFWIKWLLEHWDLMSFHFLLSILTYHTGSNARWKSVWEYSEKLFSYLRTYD